MKRFLLVGLLLVLGLVAAEWGARSAGFGDPPLAVTDPQIGYYLVPGRAYTRFGNTIRINRYGFRSDDFDAKGLTPADHVLLIGDSVVYGNHHIDQSQTVAARLQQRLRQSGGMEHVVVSSIAASSWSPANQLAFYQRFGPFRARQAWIILSSHDLADPVDRHLARLPYRTATPGGALQDVLAVMIERLESATRSILSSEAPAPQLVSTEPSLRELIALLRAQGTDVRLCLHLTAAELADSAVLPAEAQLTRVSTELGLPLIVTRAAYREAQRQGRLVHHDDIHLSVSGAETLSELLSVGLAREGMPQR